MILNEKRALVAYLDDQVMALCRDMTPFIDSDVLGVLYDKAYALIHDLEETLASQVELTAPVVVPK